MHLCKTAERLTEYGKETYDAHLLPENDDIKEAIGYVTN